LCLALTAAVRAVWRGGAAVAQTSKTVTSIGVALDGGAQRPAGGQGTVERLDQCWVVFELLLTCEYGAVLDAGLLLEVLDGVALGGKRE
jgi:hypothetical protein